MNSGEHSEISEPAAGQAAGPDDKDARTPQVIQGAGNVDRIRDILFGSQMRDYETRFSRLEETVARETTEIREWDPRPVGPRVQ